MAINVNNLKTEVMSREGKKIVTNKGLVGFEEQNMVVLKGVVYAKTWVSGLGNNYLTVVPMVPFREYTSEVKMFDNHPHTNGVFIFTVGGQEGVLNVRKDRNFLNRFQRSIENEGWTFIGTVKGACGKAYNEVLLKAFKTIIAPHRNKVNSSIIKVPVEFKETLLNNVRELINLVDNQQEVAGLTLLSVVNDHIENGYKGNDIYKNRVLDVVTNIRLFLAENNLTAAAQEIQLLHSWISIMPVTSSNSPQADQTTSSDKKEEKDDDIVFLLDTTCLDAIEAIHNEDYFSLTQLVSKYTHLIACTETGTVGDLIIKLFEVANNSAEYSHCFAIDCLDAIRELLDCNYDFNDMLVDNNNNYNTVWTNVLIETINYIQAYSNWTEDDRKTNLFGKYIGWFNRLSEGHVVHSCAREILSTCYDIVKQRGYPDSLFVGLNQMLTGVSTFSAE